MEKTSHVRAVTTLGSEEVGGGGGGGGLSRRVVVWWWWWCWCWCWWWMLQQYDFIFSVDIFSVLTVEISSSSLVRLCCGCLLFGESD